MSDQNIIPAGRFVGRATGNVRFDRKGEKQTELIVVELAFTSEGWEGVTTEFEGYLSDAAAPYTIKHLRTLGWRGPNITDTTGLGDREVTIEVRHETYKNKTQAKVSVWPLDGGNGGASMSAADIDALNRRLAGIITQSAPKATAPAAPPPFRPPPPQRPGLGGAPGAPEKDIPF